MFKQLYAAGAAAAVTFAGTPVFANNCADRDMVVERLQSKYQESLAGGGLQKSKDSQSVVEVWASEETGTFTVMLTRPDGVTCVVATGTDWHQRSPAMFKKDIAG